MDTSDDILVDYDGLLLRRVPDFPNMTIFDPELGRRRPTSVCFSDPESKDVSMSFSLERPLLESGGCHQDILQSYIGFGLASLNSNVVYQKLSVVQKIVKDPTGDDPYHCLVIGNKNKKDKRKMAKNSEMVINPLE
jgi:hypothetical protein